MPTAAAAAFSGTTPDALGAAFRAAVCVYVWVQRKHGTTSGRVCVCVCVFVCVCVWPVSWSRKHK